MKIPTVVEHRAIRLDTMHDFLDKLKAQCHPPTDYQVHKLLKVSRQAVYKWRAKQSFPDDPAALKIAARLALEPDYVLACIATDRARTESGRKWWGKLAHLSLRAMERGAKVGFKVAAGAAIAVGAATLGGMPTPAQAGGMSHNSGSAPNTHCATNRRRYGCRTAIGALAALMLGREAPLLGP